MSETGPFRFVDPARAGADVIVEDDGRVCYAYLREDGEVVGDVWLYNRAEAPLEPEWTLPDARSRMPFLNARDLCAPGVVVPIAAESDVQLDWRDAPGGRAAIVLIRGTQWAVLKPGARPGWCRIASRAGPLARPLTELQAKKGAGQ